MSIDQRVAETEKMKAHELRPVSGNGCGFNGYCSNAGLIPVATVGIVLAVVVTAAWIVGRRLIRRRRPKPSSLV